jgi:hypothetical protein
VVEDRQAAQLELELQNKQELELELVVAVAVTMKVIVFVSVLLVVELEMEMAVLNNHPALLVVLRTVLPLLVIQIFFVLLVFCLAHVLPPHLLRATLNRFLVVDLLRILLVLLHLLFLGW